MIAAHDGATLFEGVNERPGLDSLPLIRCTSKGSPNMNEDPITQDDLMPPLAEAGIRISIFLFTVDFWLATYRLVRWAIA